MCDDVTRALAYPLDTPTGNQTVRLSVLVAVGSFLTLGALAFVFGNRIEDHLDVLSAVIFGTALAVIFGLQVAVYREVITDGIADQLLSQQLGDTLRLIVVGIACFGIPLWALATIGINPFLLLILLPELVRDISTVVNYWSAVASLTLAQLLVGSYLFPAMLGALAETQRLSGTFAPRRLLPVLRSPTYAKHWVTAVGLTCGGVYLLGLIPYTVVKMFSYGAILFLPLFIVIECLLAVYLGTVVSHVAAQGYAGARPAIDSSTSSPSQQ